MKKLSILLIFLSILFLTSCSFFLVEFTTDSRAYEVKVNQQFMIVLEENPSTGYLWENPIISDESVVRFISGPSRNTKSIEIVGAPIKTKWRFEAIGKGNATITFHYRRPWEEEIVDTKVFTVTVK